MVRRGRRLYRGRGTPRRERRAFRERYGARGPRVYGAVIGKTARERAAKKRGGRIRERVRGHWATSDRGRRFKVRSHVAVIHARPHSKGHHPAPCSSACRRGQVAHRHRSSRRRRRS